MFKEFREFALKGSLLDFAVGIILGSAFAGLVNSRGRRTHAPHRPHLG